MNLKRYISAKDENLLKFTDFSSSLKSSFKTLDGYAFDFNDSITAVKLYYKIYSQKRILDSDFFKWFCDGKLYGHVSELLSSKPKPNKNSILGLNFGIKYNLNTEEITKSFYFGDKNYSSTVIHQLNNNLYSKRYYYIYNKFLINILNKSLRLNMPNHNEGIELSFRKNIAHCSIFPRINRSNLDLNESKKYCESQFLKSLSQHFPRGQEQVFKIHLDTENSYPVTKGYTSGNKFQKIYFGCFDWSKSCFSG
tara:strand:+ start:47058 stop:47813 length:756 start_codon:yes stop_codon:yes gene_type:complete